MPTRFDPSESSESRQVALARRYVPLLSALGDPTVPKDLRTGATLSLVSEMLANFTSYQRAPAPPRPVDLDGYVDVQLIDKIKAIRVLDTRASADDQRFRAEFVAWRYAVMKTESENAGRVESLLWAASRLEPLAKEFPEQRGDLEHLAVFLDAEWGVRIPPVPPIGEQRAIAYYVSFEREVLSTALRTMESPNYVSSPKAKRGGDPTRIKGSWMQGFEKHESEEA